MVVATRTEGLQEQKPALEEPLQQGLAGQLPPKPGPTRRKRPVGSALREASAKSGDQLFSESKWEPAVEAYDKTLAANPADAAAWRNRASALVHLQRYEEAVQSYDRALGPGLPTMPPPGTTGPAALDEVKKVDRGRGQLRQGPGPGPQ